MTVGMFIFLGNTLLALLSFLRFIARLMRIGTVELDYGWYSHLQGTQIMRGIPGTRLEACLRRSTYHCETANRVTASGMPYQTRPTSTTCGSRFVFAEILWT